MATLNTQTLVDKLTKLNSSQQSIETLSAWCTFHRKAARQVVSTWDSEFAKSAVPKKLALVYLANDILQNSRKKGPEFVMEFFRVLPRALKHLAKHGDAKVEKAISRLLEIWESRKVFGSSTIKLSEVVTDAETPKRAAATKSAAIPARQQSDSAWPDIAAPSEADAATPSLDDFEAINGGPDSPWEHSLPGQLPSQLQPLADALTALDEMTSSAAELSSQVQQSASQESISNATSDQLQPVQSLLASYTQLLRQQVQQHDAVQRTLQLLVDEQSGGKARAQTQLSAALQQIHAANTRQAALSASQPQPAFSQAVPPATPAQPPASFQFPGFTGPSTSTMQPTPSLRPSLGHSAGASTSGLGGPSPSADGQQEMASSAAAGHQPDMQQIFNAPAASQPAREPHASSAPPSFHEPQQQQQQPAETANGGGPAGNAEAARQSSKDLDDMDLEALGTLADVSGDGRAGTGLGMFGEAGANGSAADFAEQLTAAGNAQAFLDALASLPQDQLNLAEVLQASQAAGGNTQIEEYDPSDPY